MYETVVLTMAYKEEEKDYAKFTSVGELRYLTEALTFHVHTERGTQSGPVGPSIFRTVRSTKNR
jgi:hypothetical protein